MNESNTKPREIHTLPREFWVALLQVRNYLFLQEFDDYSSTSFEYRRDHIMESVMILECWLDVAMADGLLECQDS